MDNMALYRKRPSAVVGLNTGGTGRTVVREPSRGVEHVEVCPKDSDLVRYTSDINKRMWLVRIHGRDEQPFYIYDKADPHG